MYKPLKVWRRNFKLIPLNTFNKLFFLASVFYNKINPAASLLVRSQGYVLKGPKIVASQSTVLGDNF